MLCLNVGFLFSLGWCRQREKIDWQEPRKFDCRLVVLHQVVGEWLENQILIPDWTYFHCPYFFTQAKLSQLGK